MHEKNKNIALVLSFCSIAVWGVCYGYHFGWVDDVQDLNIMKGPFVNGCMLFDPVCFTFLQHILQGFYALMPKFPWFGSFLYLLLIYAVYTSTKLIITQLKIAGIKTKICIAILFIICFLLESINAINFTEVAILTSGVALINSYFELKNENPGWRKLVLDLFPWLIALLIRKDVVIFTTLLIGGILLFHTPLNRLRNYLRPVLVLLIALATVIIYEKGYEEQKEEHKHIAAIEPYLFTFQDAFQTNQSNLKTAEDSLLYEAVLSWNFFDKYKFNLALLQKIGYAQPLREEIFYDLPVRLKNLGDQSIKYKGYHEIYNWNIKFVFVFVINLLLLFLQLKTLKNRGRQIIAGHFIFWVSLLAVGVFVKMENRLFFPLCASYTLLNILSVSLNSVSNFEAVKRQIALTVLIFTIIISTVFATFMFYQNMVMANESNDELVTKRAFWAELAQLKNKIIVYDLHSLLLLHDSPFREINLPKNNENVVANHYYLTHFNCLNEYYNSKIGSDRIDSIYSYLHDNREKVYMVSLFYNIDFLERYMKGVYQKEYSFHRDTSFYALKKMNHNFLWMPQEYAVYRFEN
jgi:hypothetical protein